MTARPRVSGRRTYPPSASANDRCRTMRIISFFRAAAYDKIAMPVSATARGACSRLFLSFNAETQSSAECSTPTVGKRPPLPLRLALRAIQPLTRDFRRRFLDRIYKIDRIEKRELERSDRIRNSACGLVGYPDPFAQKICRGTRPGGILKRRFYRRSAGLVNAYSTQFAPSYKRQFILPHLKYCHPRITRR